MSGSRNDPAKPLEFQIKFNLGFMCFVLPATSSTSENEIPPYIYIYIYIYTYLCIQFGLSVLHHAEEEERTWLDHGGPALV